MTANASTPELLQRIQQLWLEGHSQAEIGRTLQRTPSQISGLVHRMRKAGINIPSRGSWTDEAAKAKAARRGPAKIVLPKPGPTQKGPAKSFTRKAPTDTPRTANDVGTVALGDLERHHCRWPCGHPGHADFAFCGAERLTGSSYCDHHTARAWRSSNG